MPAPFLFRHLATLPNPNREPLSDLESSESSLRQVSYENPVLPPLEKPVAPFHTDPNRWTGSTLISSHGRSLSDATLRILPTMHIGHNSPGQGSNAWHEAFLTTMPARPLSFSNGTRSPRPGANHNRHYSTGDRMNFVEFVYGADEADPVRKRILMNGALCTAFVVIVITLLAVHGVVDA